VQALSGPALIGIVPDLVGRGLVQRADALPGATRIATKIIGRAHPGYPGGWCRIPTAAALNLNRRDLEVPVAGHPEDEVLLRLARAVVGLPDADRTLGPSGVEAVTAAASPADPAVAA
jgi:hypothetical protein